MTAQPDLAGALWTNPAEPCGTVDVDADGYAGDCHGWNFYANSRRRHEHRRRRLARHRRRRHGRRPRGQRPGPGRGRAGRHGHAAGRRLGGERRHLRRPPRRSVRRRPRRHGDQRLAGAATAAPRCCSRRSTTRTARACSSSSRPATTTATATPAGLPGEPARAQPRRRRRDHAQRHDDQLLRLRRAHRGPVRPRRPGLRPVVAGRLRAHERHLVLLARDGRAPPRCTARCYPGDTPAQTKARMLDDVTVVPGAAGASGHRRPAVADRARQHRRRGHLHASAA